MNSNTQEVDGAMVKPEQIGGKQVEEETHDEHRGLESRIVSQYNKEVVE